MVGQSEESLIINELHRVASELGVYCLGTREFKDAETNFDYHRIIHIFDSWGDALNEAGLGRMSGASKTQCIRDVVKAAEISGESKLTVNKYHKIKKEYNLGSSKQSIRNHFGGFSSLVEEVPVLDGTKFSGGNCSKRWEDEEILNGLKELYKTEGCPLQVKHIRGAEEVPSLWTFRKRFDGWKNACDEASVPVSDGKVEPEFTKEECKNALRDISEKLGGVYVGRIKYSKHREEHHPTEGQIRTYFTPWRKAAYEAGITDVPPDTTLTKTVCVDSLYDAAERLGRSPLSEDYNDMDGLKPANATDFKPITGKTFDELKTELDLEIFSGLDAPGSFGYEEDQLVEEIQRLSDKLDKQPSLLDIEKYSEISANVFDGRFDELLRKSGFDGIQEINQYTDADCIKAIEEVSEEVDGRFRYKEYEQNKKDSHPSRSTVANKFDSFKIAKQRAGVEERIDETAQEYRKLLGIWSKHRRAAIELAGHKCQNCGLSRKEQRVRTNKDLIGHHIIKHKTIVKYCVEKKDMDRYDAEAIADNKNNIIVLCSSCHKRLEQLPIHKQLSKTGASDPRIDIEEYNESYTRENSTPPVLID